ncbi:hypothetical protein H8356DRAFT_1362647 [Neocallimastix lanati (nom. inval.)]|nr:hypothetical protein H8356DRAFT_1362647 [Neocallimastix sp. JGI-2020a]
MEIFISNKDIINNNSIINIINDDGSNKHKKKFCGNFSTYIDNMECDNIMLVHINNSNVINHYENDVIHSQDAKL